MKLLNQNIFHNSRAFTLIETIIFIAVFSIIVVVVIGSVIFFYRSNTYSIEQSFAVNSARKGIEVMVRDIREATYSEEGAYPIVLATTTDLTIYSDIDRDANVERVRFSLVGNNFIKGVTNPSGDPATYNDADEEISTLSEDVRNAEQSIDIFKYYDEDGNEVVDEDNINDIRFVAVNLIVNINPNRLPNEFTLRSSATIRNLRNDL